jgi:hypothetical protein
MIIDIQGAGKRMKMTTPPAQARGGAGRGLQHGRQDGGVRQREARELLAAARRELYELVSNRAKQRTHSVGLLDALDLM